MDEYCKLPMADIGNTTGNVMLVPFCTTETELAGMAPGVVGRALVTVIAAEMGTLVVCAGFAGGNEAILSASDPREMFMGIGRLVDEGVVDDGGRSIVLLGASGTSAGEDLEGVIRVDGSS